MPSMRSALICLIHNLDHSKGVTIFHDPTGLSAGRSHQKMGYGDGKQVLHILYPVHYIADLPSLQYLPLMKSPSNFTYLILVAILMAVLPFGEQPHLWQKLVLLKQGYLHQALDWFDLLMHGGPLLVVAGLLIWRVVQKMRPRANAT